MRNQNTNICQSASRRPRRIVVTGAAGFIGSHLAERHLALGDRVVGCDDFSTGCRANLETFSDNQRFRLIDGDVRTSDTLFQAIADCDIVYHLAAVVGVFRVLEQPLRTLDVNIAGTHRVLAAAASAMTPPRVVVASSSEVYGPSEAGKLAEDDWALLRPDPAGRWGYTVSKLANEAEALAWWRERMVPVVVARLFNTVGARQSPRYGMVLPRFVNQAINEEALTIFGDGLQTRSFCDVRDTVEALIRLAQRDGAIGEVVNVGADREITIRELADRVTEVTGLDVPPRFVSYEEAYGRPYEDTPRRCPDLAKLERITGFRPNRALEDTIASLLESLNVPA
jgi:UDP-glucose 4-epimerase